MPIAVVCPGCSAKLNAPDGAAGKRVKCPKPGCGTAITIPAPAATISQSEEEESASASMAANAIESVEEGNEAHRPERKPKRLIVVSVLVVALVVGGVWYGIWSLMYGTTETAKSPPNVPNQEPKPIGSHLVQPPATIPQEWEEYRSDRDNFKLRTPELLTATEPTPKTREYKLTGHPDVAMISIQVIDVEPSGSEARLRAFIEDGGIDAIRTNRNTKSVSRTEIQYLEQTVSDVLVESEGPDLLGNIQRGTLVFRHVARERKVYSITVLVTGDKRLSHKLAGVHYTDRPDSRFCLGYCDGLGKIY